MKATATTLITMVAIPSTSMVKARLGLNGIRHFWRLSSDGSFDVDHGGPSHPALHGVVFVMSGH